MGWPTIALLTQEFKKANVRRTCRTCWRMVKLMKSKEATRNNSYQNQKANRSKWAKSDPETNFLLNFVTKCSNLYGLPKIHQSSEIKTKINKLRTSYIECEAFENLSSIQLLRGPTCPTHWLSQLINHLLSKPFVDIFLSYTKDDFHFLCKLPEYLWNQKLTLLHLM